MSYKDHPFYKQKMQSSRQVLRKPATRSNYSTATGASTARSEKPFSVDDFFNQARESDRNHDHLK